MIRTSTLALALINMLSLLSACGIYPSCEHAPTSSDHRISTLTLGNPCAGLLAPLAAGGAAIIPAGGKFSAGTHWRDAVEHQATFYTAVPTMHQVMHMHLSIHVTGRSKMYMQVISSANDTSACLALLLQAESNGLSHAVQHQRGAN